MDLSLFQLKIIAMETQWRTCPLHHFEAPGWRRMYFFIDCNSNDRHSNTRLLSIFSYKFFLEFCNYYVNLLPNKHKLQILDWKFHSRNANRPKFVCKSKLPKLKCNETICATACALNNNACSSSDLPHNITWNVPVTLQVVVLVFIQFQLTGANE